MQTIKRELIYLKPNFVNLKQEIESAVQLDIDE